MLSEEEEGRLSFIGATKTLGHPVEGDDRRRRRRRRLDRGDPRHASPAGLERSSSWQVGSGVLADELIPSNDPPSAAEIRKVRDRIDGHLRGGRDRAARPGGGGRRQRHLAAPPGRRGARVRDPGAGGPRPLRRPVAEVARRFELDPRRVRILPTGVLLLEKISELLGQPLQIGKGGLREGVILDLLNGAANGSTPAMAA